MPGQTEEWGDAKPIYIQLKEEIIFLILETTLKDGDVVVSVRQLAETYDVNPLTVSKAYQELVAEKVLEKRRGIGMFVAKGVQKRLLERERKRFLKREWPDLQRRMAVLGFDPAALVKMKSRERNKRRQDLAALIKARNR